jgi:hypothetical protein
MIYDGPMPKSELPLREMDFIDNLPAEDLPLYINKEWSSRHVTEYYKWKLAQAHELFILSKGETGIGRPLTHLQLLTEKNLSDGIKRDTNQPL